MGNPQPRIRFESNERPRGYIHIPDMGAAGIREFIKYYYPQIRKEGLVVDVRGNTAAECFADAD